MAYSHDDYETLALRLGAMPGIGEKKMFGALCFMLNGNMLCGVRKSGGMVRVGPDNMAAALALDGVSPAIMGTRRMNGFVEVGSGTLAEDAVMEPLLDLAFGFVGAMPAK